MRMIQVFLVFLVTLLATCEATATKNQLVISTKDATATAKALQKFFVEDAKQNKGTGFLKVVTPSSSDEERASAGAIAAGEGARAGAGTSIVSSGTTSGETVTVTIYSNNGLWQRFQRWWNRLFHNSLSRLLREA